MERDSTNRDQTGNGLVNIETGGFRRIPGRRPVTDYGTSMVKWMRNRRSQHRQLVGSEAERPSISYTVDILPPAARPRYAAETIPAKHIHSSLNKVKHPINVVVWTPEGRRCLTGSSSGEFTLWNGMAFNFETIMQAHDAAVRAAVYSHSEDWLVSADHDGVVKYWQTNFNNVKALQAHNDPIRDLAFSPNDSKFVTASDDASLKIFDFSAGTEESVLTGHGWEAKSVDWHPSKGLLVSGSKDHQVKLWDPRTGRCLTTLHGHKNTLSKTLFEPSRGELLATCARDQTARIFDLRMMRDVCLLRGHDKDVSTMTWHPVHPSFLSTGGADGSIYHYLLDEPNTPVGAIASLPPYDAPDMNNASAQTIYPAHRIQYAHDFSVWSLSWHPLGHILASGSNDRVTRFWTRPRPGETMYYHDRYHLGETAAEAQGTWDRRGGRRAMKEEEEQEIEDEADGLVDQKMPTQMPTLPGIPGLGPSGGLYQNSATVHDLQPTPTPGVLVEQERVPSPTDIAGMDPQRFAAMMAEGKIVLPPPPVPHGMIPPPPPNFDPSKLSLDFLASLQRSSGFPPPLPPPNLSSQSYGETQPTYDGGVSVRKRTPLPSQKESLKEEQRKGKYRYAK